MYNAFINHIVFNLHSQFAQSIAIDLFENKCKFSNVSDKTNCDLLDKDAQNIFTTNRRNLSINKSRDV